MPGVGTCTTGSSARRTARTARNIVTTASVLCAAKRENGRSIVRRSRSDLFGHTQATRHASSATRIVMPGSVVGFREEKCISSFGTRSMQFLLANYIQRELRRDPESSGACYASAVGVSLQGIRLMHRPEKADGYRCRGRELVCLGGKSWLPFRVMRAVEGCPCGFR